MSRQFLMGNQAMGLAAIHAGVGLAAGYPGTPSTEVLETVAAHNPGHIHVEWSVNEKAALEIAAGAAYAGVRCLVTMKQVGLNVASDPLMSLSYIGVRGGMVVLVADDPGPISSQTEQDTRTFAAYSKIPVFDPASPEEAYEMMFDAFALSERIQAPVLFRPTTRVCHGCADVVLREPLESTAAGHFEKDSRWVIFPKLSYQRHQELVQRDVQLSQEFSNCWWNQLSGTGTRLVVAGGISRAYVREALALLGADCRLLEIATPYPFPEQLALQALNGVEEVLVVEELDPVLERGMLLACGSSGKKISILGKGSGHSPLAGEQSVESLVNCLSEFLKVPAPASAAAVPLPKLPQRPPVLCAGCPHRASFYAVKKAMNGRKAVFSGDIGCYTLGNAQPLDMVDTCLCMGAGVTIAQGLQWAEPDAVHFGFVGDSTFFASSITGVVNAVYNGCKMVLVVLDNATTAMTGHQPHPGTGRTIMKEIARKISIEGILQAIGVEEVRVVDPLHLDEAIEAIRCVADLPGVKAVIFRSPCVAIMPQSESCVVAQDRCIGCERCIRELGCPGLYREGEKVMIDPGLCTGCGLCEKVCPVQAIGRTEK